MADERATLVSEIVTLIQTNHPAMLWSEIDQALALASHDIKVVTQGERIIAALRGEPEEPPVEPTQVARRRLS